MFSIIRILLLVGPVAVLAAPVSAQSYPESVQRWIDDCQDSRWHEDREVVCEVRPIAVQPGDRRLDVDGRRNGGVRVTGWDRDSLAVFALVQVRARSTEEANAVARGIRVATDGRIRTEGTPSQGDRFGYSVSYHVFAPRRMNVLARTHNGGISVEGITGEIDVAAHNGSLSLQDVGGDVRGLTMNGAIRLSLSGARWNGRGVELRTTNGGVTLDIPERYNARLETSTVNGGFNIDFPITLEGRIGRRLQTTLGEGGPLVRVTTTNGAVRLRRA